MCCCGKPNINGEPGYSWDGKQFSTRQVNPPDLIDGDTLVYDEPGRCGGIDSHCHHYRVVKRLGSLTLLVRHGGGDERLPLSLYGQNQQGILSTLDSNSRYWVLNAIYHAYRDGEQRGEQKESLMWRKAAVEKRIRTRKLPNQQFHRVWIESDQARGVDGREVRGW